MVAARRSDGGSAAARASGRYPLLVEYFVARFAKGAGKNIRHIGKGTLERLKGYRWLGNIRELQNVVERVVILSETVSPSRF